MKNFFNCIYFTEYLILLHDIFFAQCKFVCLLQSEQVLRKLLKQLS